ncbi:hypothetical protein FD754_018265, partial [Muntiacus muntjak]
DLHSQSPGVTDENRGLRGRWKPWFLQRWGTSSRWFSLCFQTAVDVFRRIILEAEKIDGAASQGKSSCSVM